MLAHRHCGDRTRAGGNVKLPALRALAFFASVYAGHFAAPALAQDKRCGELVTLAGHNDSKLSYSFASLGNAKAVLLLLPGGPGFADLGPDGCARRLAGNSLIRTRDLFQARGFAIAVVDAPSNYRGPDGLGGFRIAPQHAEDLGKIVADLKKRTKLPVWIVGTSRGSISAVNAASLLSGEEAPEGLVITSPVTSGNPAGRKAWVAQTVFSVKLDAIKLPVLVVAHESDSCIRTPPGLAASILARTNGTREQAVMVKGGSIPRTGASVDACEGKTPHGFIGQEQEVTDGIVRFINGGAY